jgi:hypothetical protein
MSLLQVYFRFTQARQTYIILLKILKLSVTEQTNRLSDTDKHALPGARLCIFMSRRRVEWPPADENFGEEASNPTNCIPGSITFSSNIYLVL